MNKLCVSKLCVWAVCEQAGGGGRRRGRRQCTTKNKNPTQRCGELGSKQNDTIFAVFLGVYFSAQLHSQSVWQLYCSLFSDQTRCWQWWSFLTTSKHSAISKTDKQIEEPSKKRRRVGIGMKHEKKGPQMSALVGKVGDSLHFRKQGNFIECEWLG